MRRLAMLLAAVMAATFMVAGAAMTQPAQGGAERYVVVLEDSVGDRRTGGG